MKRVNHPWIGKELVFRYNYGAEPTLNNGQDMIMITHGLAVNFWLRTDGTYFFEVFTETRNYLRVKTEDIIGERTMEPIIKELKPVMFDADWNVIK